LDRARRVLRSKVAKPETRWADRGQAQHLAFWTLLGGLLALRLVAIYTENINWDEWALFARAADTLRTGQLQGGGRPGLATLLLMPFVEHSSDAIGAVRAARWLWTFFTVALIAGFGVLLRRVLGPSDSARSGASLGVGLLVLVPAFIQWSVQVRTDQPALALGLWGGVALLASQRRWGWAFLAGALFGLGFLFTQKLVYVAALAGVLAGGRLLLDGEFRLRREAARAVLCGLGGLVVLALFKLAVSRFGAIPVASQLQSGLSAFDFYRLTPGYLVYLAMAPTLLPHLILTALIGVAVLMRRKVGHRRELLLALAVLGLGGFIAWFHAAAFEYFWMTLGLFPATAAAVAFGPVRALLPTARVRRLFYGIIWFLLGAGSVSLSAAMLSDTQRVQRESLAFIDRNFTTADRGFQPERALFYRDDPEPLPTFFAEVIYRRFSGPDSVAQIGALLNEFRERPIMFVVESWRLDQFPEAVRDQLERAYVPYHASVMIPGYSFGDGSIAPRQLDTFVPGVYRWWSEGGEDESALVVGGRTLRHGDSIALDRGLHEARLVGKGAGGFLAWAVPEPPGSGVSGFYVRGSRRFTDRTVP